jgi:hypothetical protein
MRWLCAIGGMAALAGAAGTAVTGQSEPIWTQVVFMTCVGVLSLEYATRRGGRR